VSFWVPIEENSTNGRHTSGGGRVPVVRRTDAVRSAALET